MTDEEIIGKAHDFLRRTKCRLQRVEIPLEMCFTEDEPDTATVEIIGSRSVVTRRYKRGRIFARREKTA